MKRLYSPSTGTTYLVGVHSVLPADVVEISEELYLSVIGNPEPGKIRVHNDSGLPYLVDAPEPSIDLPSQERSWRNAQLSAVMWLRERHRDQAEAGVVPTLNNEEFKELISYIQLLRDWPQSPHFPDSQYRPVAPPWITEQTQ
ncbi:phage tail assembly chaperone [Pseudomonas chlororaphis]|uniref:phage tail assembly chaperone n=1 Tax=Pseudomonas chlororaphis TaxID=587753 RepID=UPI00209AC8CA|nr:tail fiber assembly protein [Pseudomonas chlororaphis]MCO7608657.1 phage tail assembly chaperone [Pseudomonas chlororaphis]